MCTQSRLIWNWTLFLVEGADSKTEVIFSGIIPLELFSHSRTSNVRSFGFRSAIFRNVFIRRVWIIRQNDLMSLWVFKWKVFIWESYENFCSRVLSQDTLPQASCYLGLLRCIHSMSYSTRMIRVYLPSPVCLSTRQCLANLLKFIYTRIGLSAVDLHMTACLWSCCFD